MVTAQTTETGQVYLNGVRYTIQGRVQRTRITEPTQFRTGPISQDSHPRADVLAWADQRGGIGIDVMDNRDEDLTRCWFSTCSLRHKGHIVLQRLATATAVGTGVGGGIDALAELGSKIYAIGGTSISEYDNAGDSWTIKRNMADLVTDAITVPLNSTETLVVARSSGVDYSTDGSTWSQQETNVKYLTWWRDLLWGICSDGNMRFTSDLSTWTTVTKFSPQLGTVTGLLTGPGRNGNEVIYATAQDGLYEYDNQTERFFKTQLAVPYHPSNGKGSLAWRNSIYFPAGLAIYRYTPGEINTVDLVGPDRDDGLPEEHRGIIQKFVTTHNDLIAVVGPTSQSRTAGAQAFRGGTAGPQAHRGAFSGAVTTANGNSIKGLVLGWNQQGWEVKWRDDNALGPMQAAIVSNAYGVYRLWWAAGPRVYWMEVPVDIVNPNRVNTTSFASSGTWETPWFTADVLDFDKTALGVHIDSVHPTSSDTIVLSYARNYLDSASSNFTAFATKTTTGDTEYFFPSGSSGESSADQSGLSFESFKIRANLTRGNTDSSEYANSPDIKRLGLVFKKRVEPLYGFTFNVNMRDDAQGVTAQERRGLLEGLAANKNLFRFGYTGENDSAQDFWVELVSITSLDGTGYDGSDLAQVSVAEVH